MILHSARPGGRLWEVSLKGDDDGNLRGGAIKTFQFKNLDSPASEIITRIEAGPFDPNSTISSDPLSGLSSFSRLVAAESDVVLTMAKGAIIVIDPKTYSVTKILCLLD